MIDAAIVSYMQDHKRLVVPQFGAFLRKGDTGEVVFMEFLKDDDHEFTSYLTRLYSLSDDEALRAIANFVAEVKKRIMYKGGYLIEGLGILRPGPNNMYRLDYDPEATADTLPQEEAAQESGETSGQEPQGGGAYAAADAGTAESTDSKAEQGHASCGPVWDESVKGLRYGKPNKSARRSGKKRTDTIMIIAIIVALAAIGALIYGVVYDKEGTKSLFGGSGRIEIVDETEVNPDSI